MRPITIGSFGLGIAALYGLIAFVQGVDPTFRAGRVYSGQVVVSRGVHGREVAWTSDAAPPGRSVCIIRNSVGPLEIIFPVSQGDAAILPFCRPSAFVQSAAARRTSPRLACVGHKPS